MKTFFTTLLILTSATFTVNAQPGKPRGDGQARQKIEALYVAYITRELKLTESEAQKFWPIHTQYDDDLRAIKGDASEFEKQQNILNVKKKYESRFSQVIGAERTNDFFRKDAEFRKRLVERVSQSRRNNMQRKGPGN